MRNTMEVRAIKKLSIACCAVLALSSCGGVSDADWASQDPSASAVSTSSFDVQAGWTTLNNEPNAFTLKVTGSCTGKYILSNSMALITQLSNVVGNVITVNRTYGALEPCSSPYENRSSSEQSRTYYYYSVTDNQYKNYLAYDESNTYIFAWRAIASFPRSAKVGDSGLIGIIDKKIRATNAKISVEEWSYAIEQDTAYSAVFNLIVKTYNTNISVNNTDYLSAPVSKTEEFRYLINQSNGMYLIKYDRVDADGFTIHGRL